LTPPDTSFDIGVEVSRLFADLGSGLAVNFSAGVAALEPERTPLAAVERADQAMYRAKTGGRNRTELDLAPATS